MESGPAGPSYLIGVALALVACVLLFNQERRQRPDFVGRVKADAYRAMLRALVLIVAGLLLALGEPIAGPLPRIGSVHPQKVAMALIAVGGVAFLARGALYTLRIKPQLDAWQTPAVASPASVVRDVQPREE